MLYIYMKSMNKEPPLCLNNNNDNPSSGGRLGLKCKQEYLCQSDIYRLNQPPPPRPPPSMFKYM